MCRVGGLPPSLNLIRLVTDGFGSATLRIDRDHRHQMNNPSTWQTVGGWFTCRSGLGDLKKNQTAIVSYHEK